MLLTVRFIQRHALICSSSKRGEKPNTVERHLLDLFFHIRCQICFGQAGSEATFQGESLTSVSCQQSDLLPSTSERRWNFAFQFKDRAEWAASFSLRTCFPQTSTPKVILLISVPGLILQIIYIALKIRKLLFTLHSSLCIEDSKMNKGTELQQILPAKHL